MVLGTMYIFVSDMEKSMRFYRELLQEEPLYANDDRWVQFSNKIAFYNKSYDTNISYHLHYSYSPVISNTFPSGSTILKYQ